MIAIMMKEKVKTFLMMFLFIVVLFLFRTIEKENTPIENENLFKAKKDRSYSTPSGLAKL
jgi:hypothetical protein